MELGPRRRLAGRRLREPTWGLSRFPTRWDASVRFSAGHVDWRVCLRRWCRILRQPLDVLVVVVGLKISLRGADLGGSVRMRLRVSTLFVPLAHTLGCF